jgi:hypothetical protein
MRSDGGFSRTSGPRSQNRPTKHPAKWLIVPTYPPDPLTPQAIHAEVGTTRTSAQSAIARGGEQGIRRRGRCDLGGQGVWVGAGVDAAADLIWLAVVTKPVPSPAAACWRRCDQRPRTVPSASVSGRPPDYRWLAICPRSLASDLRPAGREGCDDPCEDPDAHRRCPQMHAPILGRRRRAEQSLISAVHNVDTPASQAADQDQR